MTSTWRSLRLGALATASLLMLGACANLAPEQQSPAAPVAAQFPGASATRATNAAAAPLDWTAYYQDQRLRKLIELALQNNRDLRVALLNVEQARAQARITAASQLPTVGAGFSASRQPDSTGKNVNNFQAGLQISAYELDLFGKLRNNSDAATARYLASAEGARAAQISLIGAVAAAQFSLQADEELLALARQTLVSREDSHRLTRLRFDQGAASSLELASAQSALEAARAALAQAQRQRDQDENALVLLIAQPLPADLPPAQGLNAQALSDIAAGLPSEVLVQRPDVLQAEQQLRAANANIGAARAAFFPAITLTSNVGTASSELSGLFKNTVWTFASQALMPIFDAGRNEANLTAAKAARDIAVAQYEKSIQSAFREVADALSARSTLAEQARAQDAQAAAEAERLRLVELRFANGASSSLELLDAQRASFAARQAALQVRLAALQSGVQLYKALGGGVASAIR
ncbi:efflux transporter outer membrane subunit [Paucibacter sp. APW11]|uniref:Efflux transporter outer membrane subunit n=1 Tax=Roseateles aquae TaxID=3077235 RepID=A0ABU3PEW5_9BURK|nr:efflux transporter outer membrane subunit [Paucibacter sp. APW11]MDT9000697.1 efflux transporter outer membrane subunit [Paucibacter sp. APW11]